MAMDASEFIPKWIGWSETYPLNPHQTTCSMSAPPWSAACKVQEGQQGSVRKNVGRNLPFIKHKIARIHTD